LCHEAAPAKKTAPKRVAALFEAGAHASRMVLAAAAAAGCGGSAGTRQGGAAARPDSRFTGILSASALADHNSLHGSGWANMPNDIHNTRIEDGLSGTAFRDFVRQGRDRRWTN